MICERCHGSGKERLVGRTSDANRLPCWVTVPCRDCDGCGLAHCCEGERPGNVTTGEAGGSR
jgi:hypothetical protein